MKDLRLSDTETRRAFLKTAGAAAVGLSIANGTLAQAARAGKKKAAAQAPANTAAAGGGSKDVLALRGGAKAVTVPQATADKWPRYGAPEEQAILKVLRAPTYSANAELEKDWTARFKVPYCKAYCNGTSALTSMYFALGLPPGSEILVPSYTFFATIVPMRLFGLVPVFVDINPRTLNLDLEDAKKRLTPNTKAIVPVHWIGLPCDMDQICDWAKEKGLIVLEDACHAHGASLQGKFMGSWGRMGAFSFQASKPLPGIEGGMANFQEKEDFERGVTFGHYDTPRSFGEGSHWSKYAGSGLGMKLRMHPMAAALVCCQLVGLEERRAAGVKQVRQLNDRICQLPGLYEPPCRKDAARSYYSWNMLFLDEKKAGMTREACVKALRAEGVTASAHTYTLQHKLPLYAEEQWWHHKPLIPELPGSEEANMTCLGLPFFTEDVPELNEQYAQAFEKVWAHRGELAAG